MDRRQQFRNQLTGLNLLQLPVAGNDLGNPRQFLENLGRLQMPQVQGTQNMNRELYRQDSRGERNRQFSDNYYDREQMACGDRGQRSLREAGESRNFDRGDYHHEDRGRIHGLMDKEISLRSIFPESSRHSEKRGREELERGNYFASKNNLQSFEKAKGLKLSVIESKYGRRDNTAIPWYAQLRPNCYLLPPSDDTDVLPLGIRQPGCLSISVGGLPMLADEFIVREVFNVCGPIEKITFKSARNNTKARTWQVRFSRHDSVEKAVQFNGHILVIGDGSDRKNKISRFNVNYDQETNDDNNLKTSTTMSTQKPRQTEEDRNLSLMYYNRKDAFQILDRLRHDTSIVQSLETMAHWFERGECNRSTVNVFHSMLNTTHSFVKRLIIKRKEHEEQVEKQRRQTIEQAHEIKQQCDAVWKVFEAATKKKAWDIFTKAQRKTISQWHAVIRNEIKSAQEAEIQNREEVGMDLDDEVPNLGGLIEQPALQMVEEQQPEQDESLSHSTAKKPRSDAQASESGSDSANALKLENEKLRTQVESLKGIAEQNTNLMWSMQSYQYQADVARQQYGERLKEKDQEITRLQQAVRYIKQNITDTKLLTDLETLTSDQPSELQIVVDLSNDLQKATDEVAAIKHENGAGNDAEEIKEEIMEDDDGKKVKQITENHNEVGEEESGEQLGEKEADSRDISSKGPSSLLSQSQHQVTVEDGDFQSEGVPTQKENTEVSEKTAEESNALGAASKEEEKPTEEAEEPPEESGKPVEEDTSPEDAVVESVEGGDTPVEGEKPEEEDAMEEENQAEEEDDEEEGCGRFVQIDDEQFEVIDDMDEDSEDDYKEVVTRSPAKESVEQMHEQLAGKDDYKEVSDHHPLNENDEQASEQFAGKDNHKEVADQQPLDENDQQASEQFPGKDDYKEVADHQPLNEYDWQVSEQLPADWSVYQQDYNAQYQNWLSAGMASYGPMELGPTLVRLSGEELVLVGIMCSYLQLCPSGATSGEIRDHLSRQFKERRKDVVEKLLSSLPVLFSTGESSGNTKWKFCGFDMLLKSER